VRKLSLFFGWFSFWLGLRFCGMGCGLCGAVGDEEGVHLNVS